MKTIDATRVADRPHAGQNLSADEESGQEPLLGGFGGRPLGQSDDSRPSLAAISTCHDSEPNG